MEMKRIKIFDTTLRDGEQGVGCCMSISKKERILEGLDELNLDIIELGFPAASKEDAEWIRLALSKNIKTKTCVFTRLNKPDIDILLSVAQGKNVQVQLLGVGSEIHLEKKRKITHDESFIELREAIQYLKQNGMNDISVIFEDSTRGSYNLLSQVTSICVDEKVSGISIADTVGCSTPNHIFSLIQYLKSIIPDNMDLGIHCHNDMGLATANTLSAIQAGATLIQTTLGGIGERTGNCALEEVFSVLHTDFHEYNVELVINPKELHRMCRFVFQELGKDIPVNKPIIGKHAFSTTAGIHQDGLLKDKYIYTHVDPEIYGRKHNLIFNRLSGRKLINLALKEHHLSPDFLESFYEYLLGKKKDFEIQEIEQEYFVFFKKMDN